MSNQFDFTAEIRVNSYGEVGDDSQPPELAYDYEFDKISGENISFFIIRYMIDNSLETGWLDGLILDEWYRVRISAELEDDYCILTADAWENLMEN